MDNILAVIQDRVLYLYFHSPTQGNSFGCDEATAINKFLEKDFDGLVFLSKHPSIFCSGGNLKDYHKKSPKEGLQINQNIRKLLKKINKLEVPTLCWVDGLCIGGGIEVLSCFDYVWASPKALFSFWQRRIGLSFGWGGRERLRRRLSESNLIEHAIDTNWIDVYKAKEIGLVDKILPSFCFESEAGHFFEKLLNLAPCSTPAIKNRQKKSEIDLFEELWNNPAHRQALEKFNS